MLIKDKMETEKLISAKETADILGVTIGLLMQARYKNTMDLPYYKISHKNIKYKLSEVLEYIEKNKI